MNVEIMLLSFIAGSLTTFSPCCLPVLPVIVGSSSIQKSPLRIFVMNVSLALAIILFTLLLKVSSLFINFSEASLHILSGAVVFLLGLSLLLPNLWDRFASLIKFNQVADNWLKKAASVQGLPGAVLIGLALGPIFSSCSPAYAFILASVFPVSFTEGFVYLVCYVLGLFICLFLFSLLGQRLSKKLSWAINPKGWFKRTLAVVFMILGLLIITRLDQKSSFLSSNLFNMSYFDQFFSDKINSVDSTKKKSVDENYAPEIVGISAWINSKPLSLEELRGKVVLIDFWSYMCVSCIRALPRVIEWHETYKDKNLVVIGVHSPQFAFEKKQANVEEAVRKHKIPYPVAIDNDFLSWQAYKARSWPSLYLIDKSGVIRYTHFGEGNYEVTEEAIQNLLLEGEKSDASSR